MGRTNIVLDDELLKEAMKLSRAKSIKELVDRSLREFVKKQRRLAMLKMRGCCAWEGDLSQLRGDNDASNC